jgi:hypothetical protein
MLAAAIQSCLEFGCVQSVISGRIKLHGLPVDQKYWLHISGL